MSRVMQVERAGKVVTVLDLEDPIEDSQMDQITLSEKQRIVDDAMAKIAADPAFHVVGFVELPRTKTRNPLSQSYDGFPFGQSEFLEFTSSAEEALRQHDIMKEDEPTADDDDGDEEEIGYSKCTESDMYSPTTATDGFISPLEFEAEMKNVIAACTASSLSTTNDSDDNSTVDSPSYVDRSNKTGYDVLDERLEAIVSAHEHFASLSDMSTPLSPGSQCTTADTVLVEQQAEPSVDSNATTESPRSPSPTWGNSGSNDPIVYSASNPPPAPIKPGKMHRKQMLIDENNRESWMKNAYERESFPGMHNEYLQRIATPPDVRFRNGSVVKIPGSPSQAAGTSPYPISVESSKGSSSLPRNNRYAGYMSQLNIIEDTHTMPLLMNSLGFPKPDDEFNVVTADARQCVDRAALITFELDRQLGMLAQLNFQRAVRCNLAIIERVVSLTTNDNCISEINSQLQDVIATLNPKLVRQATTQLIVEEQSKAKSTTKLTESRGRDEIRAAYYTLTQKWSRAESITRIMDDVLDTQYAMYINQGLEQYNARGRRTTRSPTTSRHHPYRNPLGTRREDSASSS